MSELRMESAPVNARRETRRMAMIDAAEALFLEQGYEQTSLAAIVKRSGGSLATLYELFGNKQGLLHAMIAREGDGQFHLIDELETADLSVAELLRRHAHKVYEHTTAPRSIAISRIIIAEALRDPEFGRQLYHDVHLPRSRALAAVFAKWNAASLARFDDPMTAAELLFALIGSDTHLRVLIGGQDGLLTRDQLDGRLEFFLSHYSIR